MSRSLIAAAAALALLAACSPEAVAPAPTEDPPLSADPLAAAPLPLPIPPASKWSNYCSKTWPGTSSWRFNYGTAHPCTDVSGGTVVRAGMYSTTGRNKVIGWCNPNYKVTFDGYGKAPLDQAFLTAGKGRHMGGCVFTVAPAEMPIFDWPYPPGGNYPANYHGSGFDFMRPPYDTDLAVVDHRGVAVNFLSDHDAHDFGMVPGTPLRAVADGVVITAGMYKGIYTNCNRRSGLPKETGLPDCGHQGVIIVRHTAKASNPAYDERLATGYFHVQQIAARILAGCTPVDTSKGLIGLGGVCSVPVTKGQVLGYSGRRNTNSAHLHFNTWRLSNTSRRDGFGYRAPDSVLSMPSCCNFGGSIGPSLVIDPYGWRPGTPDPWAYRARNPSAAFPQGAGALSIRLWKVDPPFHW
jgi:murein DD-endopeptidase MepM/ murein hydrolase activator NlpD